MPKRISYANVVSTLALVFAMAGGAVAAGNMAPKNSVNGRSIKNDSVTTTHPLTGRFCVGLTDGAVTVATATVEYSSSNTTIGSNGGIGTHVEINRVGGTGNSCAAGMVDVRTFTVESNLGGDGDYRLDLMAADQPFFILIP